ncbi:MAG: hypothetical protein ABS70_05735 [Nitrospira sp. SCN 59-13]|nr:MAG: hypothetical protein ABS70_05735 [Nitrospira sp. SCN 59-13]
MRALLEISDRYDGGRKKNGAPSPHQKSGIIINDANSQAQNECPEHLSQWGIDAPLSEQPHARIISREWAR